MKLKAFGIFCLSFFMTTALSSCDSDEITDQPEEVSGSENPTLTVLAEQVAGSDGYDENGVIALNFPSSQDVSSIYSGLKLNFSLSGITKIELESVDGYALAGTTGIQWGDLGEALTGEVENANFILVFNAPDENGLTPGKDYSIFTLPCDLYGGYRLSIYREGLVAHYFGVHQTVEMGSFVTPADLIEEELEFDDPDAPLVEEERPELDATTTALLRIIRKTKCFDFWERNVLFPKTKRSFFRTPKHPLPCPFPLNFSLLIITKKFGNLAKNRYICIV